MWCKRSVLQVLVIALAILAASGTRAAGGVDLTREFQVCYRSNCAFGTAHAEVMRKYKVLLVPGYFSDVDPAYFADQLRWLSSIGVQHERVAVKSKAERRAQRADRRRGDSGFASP